MEVGPPAVTANGAARSDRGPPLPSGRTGRRSLRRKARLVSALPNVELLESTHEFPGDYMFKVIGQDDDTLAARVRAAVVFELPEDHEPAMSVRRTASGRHMCVTIEPHVADAHQVLAIYRRIYALDGLVMVW